MEYISHTDYTNMLKNFGKSSAQQLNEAMSPSARRAFEKDLQSDPDYIELKKKAAIGTNMPDEVPNVAKRDHYVDDRFDDEFDDEEEFDYLEEKGLTPKQKKFAALAPPADKITYADKIVGAKKGIKEGDDSELDAKLANLATRLKGQTLPYDKLEQIAKALADQNYKINARGLEDYLKKHDVKVNEYDYKDNYPGSWGYREGKMKDEGLNLPSPDMQATGPTIQTVEEDGHNAAYNFSELSPDQRNQLAEYIKSMKTIKQEIAKLLEKAKGGVKTEDSMGGDRTNLVMTKDTVSE